MVEYLRRGDQYLAYRCEGEGSIDILYLSGMITSIDVLDDEPHVARYNRRLASIGRLIQFDVPGIGLSDAPDADLSVDHIVDTALALVDALGVDRPVVMGANSGGLYAIALAARVPERVRALVLIDTQARSLRADDYPIGFPDSVVARYVDDTSAPGIEWSPRGGDSYAMISPSLVGDAGFRQWAERAIRQAASPAAAARHLRLVAYADVRSCLPAITAPTLVVARNDNAFMPAAHGRYLAEHIRGATFVGLPGADYAPYSGDSDALLDQVEEFLTGRRGGGTERVLATLLFTDIVDSTSRAVALGDREWRALLDAHDSIVRAELARYGGREVNTTGDGFLSAFDSPTQAVRAGSAIVSAAAESEVAVRVGVHTGECERRGDDLAGLTVHIAARVAGCAAGGEVLVSRTVRDLVAGSGLRFDDRGEHELKGVPERWQLFSLGS